jgi:hypothetical protein
MIVQIAEEAAREFAASVLHYESKELALGIRFRNQVASVVDRIQQNPELIPLRPRGYRRVNLRAFPYYVAFIIEGDIIWIVAIAHVSARPEYWIGRH